MRAEETYPRLHRRLIETGLVVCVNNASCPGTNEEACKFKAFLVWRKNSRTHCQLSENLSENRKKMDLGYSSVVQCLTSMLLACGSVPALYNKQTNKSRNKGAGVPVSCVGFQSLLPTSYLGPGAKQSNAVLFSMV